MAVLLRVSFLIGQRIGATKEFVMPTQEASVIRLNGDVVKIDASFLSVTKEFVMPTQEESVI
jgi:hypothetical protein